MSKKKQENIEKEVIGQPPEDIAEAAEPELTPLEKAEKEAAEYKDMALRARAEFENYRKNNLTLAKEVRERTTADVLESILPVYDSFDRAMEAVTDSKVLEGLAIIREQLQAALDRHGVKAIEAAGEIFDPKLHNCIMQVDKPEMAGKVVYEIQKGYRIGDRILRHSVVAVGKAEEESPKAADSVGKGEADNAVSDKE